MNMRYAKRSEDTEQINVVSWAGWNMSIPNNSILKDGKIKN